MRRLVDKLYQRNRKTGRRQAEIWCPFALHDNEAVEATSATVNAALQDGLDQPVIVADNVAEYLFCDTDKERWDFDQDFPCLAPPFESFWIDWRRPTRPLLTRAKVDPVQWMREYPAQCAVLCSNHRHEDGGWGMGVVQFSLGNASRWPMWDGIGWLLELDEHGGFISMEPKLAPGVESFADECGVGVEDYVHSSASGLYPWALTLSFLNCKNVERERVSPPEKAQRAHRRKHDAQLVDYDVLKITPFGGGGSSSGGGGGSEKRLHIVRGHFATYTEEAPLFGHFTGTVWRESHTRGHGPGHHEKRYDVQAPTGGTT